MRVLLRLSGFQARWAAEPFRRHVAYFTASRMISMTGARVATIALVAVVYSRTGGSGGWVGAAVFTQFVCSVLAAPWAGALGDRFDRRLVMLSSDLTAAAVFVVIAFTHTPLLLVLLSGVAAIVESPFGSASSAFLLMLVPEAERTRATATRASGVAVGTIVGGALGGVLVAAVGGTAAFLVNSLSFVISAALVASIRGSYKAATSADPGHAGIWAGTRVIAKSDALRLVLAASGAALVGFGMINVGEFPLFAKLGSGALGFGIATAGYGIGSYIGAHIGRRAEGQHREKQLLFLGWLVAGLAIVACGITPSSASVVALFTIAGVGASAALLAGTLIIQRHTLDPVRSRVFAASSGMNTAAMSLAMFIAGFLIGPLGPVTLCVACGLVTLTALLPSALVPPRGQPPWNPDSEHTDSPETRPRRWLLAT